MLRQYLGAEQLPHELSQQAAGRLKNKMFIPANTAAGSAVVKDWDTEGTLLQVKQLLPCQQGAAPQRNREQQKPFGFSVLMIYQDKVGYYL